MLDAIGIKHLDGSRLPMYWESLSVSYRYFTVPTMQSLWHFWGAAWRTLFSRSFLSNRRFQSYRMGEDLLFSVSCFVEMERWILADAQCYFYRAREGSAMRSRPRVEVVKDWLEVQENLIQCLLDSKFLYVVEGDKNQFLKRWGGWLYYTVNEVVLKLSLNDMRLCYDQWIDNLIRFGRSVRWPLHKRIPIMVVRRIRIPWLARAIIYWPLLFRRKFLHI